MPQFTVKDSFSPEALTETFITTFKQPGQSRETTQSAQRVHSAICDQLEARWTKGIVVIQGVYRAAQAMEVAGQRHEIVARNLAHSGVAGYRRSVTSQGTYGAGSSRDDSGELRPSIDFNPGAIVSTGRPLDVALRTNGFFVVSAEPSRGEGAPVNPSAPSLLTRNGSFEIAPDGFLTTHDGRRVLGEAGFIQVTGDRGLGTRIDERGRLLVDNPDGTTSVIGTLRVVEVADVNQLRRVGTTLFEDPNGIATNVRDPLLAVSSSESSNVNAVEELVTLISVQRSYEAATRTMRTMMQVLESRINLQGR